MLHSERSLHHGSYGAHADLISQAELDRAANIARAQLLDLHYYRQEKTRVIYEENKFLRWLAAIAIITVAVLVFYPS